MRVRTCHLSEIYTSINEPWVDRSRKPFISGDTAYLPVLEGYQCSIILPERERKGRGYQRIGDIIAFHGIRPDESQIKEVISLHHPRGVIWYRSHLGDLRIPDVEVLWGETGEIELKENGISYRFDPVHVMFSQGNRQEKKRLSLLVKPGEVCCDMFAGIGYFTLTLAKAGAVVHSIELNPLSVRYLKQNIKLNRLERNITVSEGDCRDLITGTYDRIHMGHYESVSFLKSALFHVHSGSVIHIHSIGDASGEINKILAAFNVNGGLSSRVIKTIGPCKKHMVFDLEIS